MEDTNLLDTAKKTMLVTRKIYLTLKDVYSTYDKLKKHETTCQAIIRASKSEQASTTRKVMIKNANAVLGALNHYESANLPNIIVTPKFDSSCTSIDNNLHYALNLARGLSWKKFQQA